MRSLTVLRLGSTSEFWVPCFKENFSWNVSANVSIFSMAEYWSPFGLSSGWDAGVLFNCLLLSLYMEFKSGLREYINRSHSSCWWVFRIDLTNIIVLFNQYLVTGSLKCCNLRWCWFFSAISDDIFGGRCWRVERFMLIEELLIVKVCVILVLWSMVSSIFRVVSNRVKEIEIDYLTTELTFFPQGARL